MEALILPRICIENSNFSGRRSWQSKLAFTTISQPQSLSHFLNKPLPPPSSILVAHAEIARKTCRVCKQQFDPAQNHAQACRFHTAHFGGETKRKFESVYKGGTMDTPGGGEVSHYWHCCGNPNPFDPGCEASPHLSYDE